MERKCAQGESCAIHGSPEPYPYPHEGGCAGCSVARLCNACGSPLDPGRCTNGRCSSCHAAHCTPGGDTSPGHGFGTVAKDARRVCCSKLRS